MVSIGIPHAIDTVALVCISPRCEDFITYRPSNIKIKDLSSLSKVAGEGLIWWENSRHDGQFTTLKFPSYPIPQVEVCLLSPQVLIGLLVVNVFKLQQT